VSHEDQEYHRRRSEMELEVAVAADDQATALAHLELARMHWARRQLLSKARSSERLGKRAFAFRPDKEA